MPDLLRPATALAVLRLGPRLFASSLRLTGAVLGGIADAIDGIGDEPLFAPTANGSPPAPAAEQDEEVDDLYDGGASAGASAASPPADAGAADAEPAAPQGDPAPSPAPPTESDAHIDDEPELVGEFADPGAQDGAGAEVTVDEPWPGYDRLTAEEIAERTLVEPDATIAVIELYERAHRARRSVLDAAETELRRRAATPGRATQEEQR